MSVTQLRGLDERLIVDTSEDRPVLMLIGPRGSYLRVSPSTHQFLRQVGDGVSFEHLARSMRRESGQRVSSAELEAVYRRLMSRIAEVDRHAGQLRGGFWFRRRLVPGPVVARIANACSAALHPAVAIVTLCAIAITAALGARFVAHVATTNFWTHFWPSYGLFLVSLMAHELGHASACARHGVKPSDIGLTIYFIYPSFYSDVTGAWELKRWQRVVVDLGGVYFQMIFGVGCAAAYALTGWEPLCGTLVLIAGSCLFSLNPILKFDGYWVVADALGVTNLARQPVRIVRHLVALARGRSIQALPWSRSVHAALVVYAAASFSFWAWFLWRLLPGVGRQALRCLDVGSALAARLVSAPPGPDWPLVREFATSMFFLAFFLIMIARLIWSVIVWARAPRKKRP